MALLIDGFVGIICPFPLVKWYFEVYLHPLLIWVSKWNGPVAQLNRVFDYGSKGFRFES